MPRLRSGTELDTLRQQQIELARRIKDAEAKARLRRKTDLARCEQLAGRAVLAYLDENSNTPKAATIRAVLEAAITRPADRLLFAGFMAEPPVAAGVADTATATADKAQAAE